jgi:hypothetical protein
MPFAYFEKLTRRQQAIYRQSDAVTTMPVARPETLRPLVGDLARALETGARATTGAATQRLASGLARALELPPVRVKVLAARPHARWGELHGLYETTGRAADTPLITLWMRTARQKRVVAFRTFLRTLLHEIGHHVDYTRLGLGDSFHTQGFYQRESHLFHQLVTDGGHAMQTPTEQMARMARTADDLAAAIRGTPDHLVAKRPDERSWSAIEVLCHLRDTEEAYMTRFQMILAMHEPTFPLVEPDRWASERQYRQNDAREAIEAFRIRRAESLELLRGLRPEDRARAGLHATRGRMTIDDVVALMAWHDDNHLDQLKRALAGAP